jgi:hypothetical protein
MKTYTSNYLWELGHSRTSVEEKEIEEQEVTGDIQGGSSVWKKNDNFR